MRMLVGVETTVVPLETMIVVILVHPIDLKLQYRHDPPETAQKYQATLYSVSTTPREVTPEETHWKVIVQTFQPSALECLAD